MAERGFRCVCEEMGVLEGGPGGISSLLQQERKPSYKGAGVCQVHGPRA